ncbi:uncharacterized protein KGF55_002213 [Candida pseudojiufengensis]|uniref:uncharacterized protein n=1 Tax=Candida pseudojiufengensis TaxID=497109 RepID=UPI002224E9F1|nr:uncharacterized protein KGF55_002213 [Candida pseudojiufengensis]KAI5964271.1 hypothetical protein KGF55_002213 [Candida pseudojiufengensis]
MDLKSTIIRVLSILLFSLTTFIHASPGDDLYAFSDCLYQCEQITCKKNPYNLFQEEFYNEFLDNGVEIHYYNDNWKFQSMPLPFHLKILGWTCESNCDYQCQRIITEERYKNNEEIYQFHGKWPFLRVFGIQELFSVLMSLGNLYVTYKYGFKKFWKIVNNKKLPIQLRKQFYNILFVSVVTMLAWIASTVFHTRDYPITEHLDYYLAGATILSSFHALGARLFELYKPEKTLYRWSFTFLCVAAYIYHVQRLYFDWSYTYNMRANIIIGICQNLFYCLIVFKLYCKYFDLEQLDPTTVNLSHINYISFKRIILPSFYSRSSKLYTLYPLLLCTIVICGMMLEIFDFPPIFFDLIDTHSLWHLVTIIPAYMGWYDWLIWDVFENVWPDLKQAEIKKNE